LKNQGDSPEGIFIYIINFINKKIKNF